MKKFQYEHLLNNLELVIKAHIERLARFQRLTSKHQKWYFTILGSSRSEREWDAVEEGLPSLCIYLSNRQTEEICICTMAQLQGKPLWVIKYYRKRKIVKSWIYSRSESYSKNWVHSEPLAISIYCQQISSRRRYPYGNPATFTHWVKALCLCLTMRKHSVTWRRQSLQCLFSRNKRSYWRMCLACITNCPLTEIKSCSYSRQWALSRDK